MPYSGPWIVLLLLIQIVIHLLSLLLDYSHFGKNFLSYHIALVCNLLHVLMKANFLGQTLIKVVPNKVKWVVKFGQQ